MAEILTRDIIERLHEDALQNAELPPITHLQRTAELEIEACQEMTAQRAEIAALKALLRRALGFLGGLGIAVEIEEALR